jgi:hypothetical protein
MINNKDKHVTTRGYNWISLKESCGREDMVELGWDRMNWQHNLGIQAVWVFLYMEKLVEARANLAMELGGRPIRFI